MFFLTPRYLKEAKHYRHALKRLIHYKQDILPGQDLEALQVLLARLKKAISNRSRQEVADVQADIDKTVGRIAPPPANAGLRENVEVFLVAIIIATGVRSYFLQPFKIPTGSMQPTLYGIVGEPSNDPLPNPLIRAFDLVVRGKHHIDLTAKQDETVVDLKEKTYLNFFTFTTIVCERGTYTLFAPVAPLAMHYGIRPGRFYRAGETIARGAIQTGDQVFVDKMSYNFVFPARGDVFVFKTTGIRLIERSLPPGMTQHYIKRLAGVPGDTLRIEPPNLFINGSIVNQWVFQRVMSCLDGYEGYSNRSSQGMKCPILGSPTATFTVEPKSYFALGDNSYNSSDSRFWGKVPEDNVAGRGLFVYWPFSKRWGLIR